MSLVFNAAGGGKPHNICGAAWHRAIRNSYFTVANDEQGDNSKFVTVDNDCFSFSNGVYTCLRAGTYQIDYFGRGSVNSSGTSIAMYYRVYAAGEIVASATDVTTSGVHGTVENGVTLAAGDTVYAQTRNASGSTWHDFGYVITRVI